MAGGEAKEEVKGPQSEFQTLNQTDSTQNGCHGEIAKQKQNISYSHLTETLQSN